MTLCSAAEDGYQHEVRLHPGVHEPRWHTHEAQPVGRVFYVFVGEDIMFLGCPVCPSVLSFVRSDIVTTNCHEQLVNSFDKTNRGYSLTPNDDLGPGAYVSG